MRRLGNVGACKGRQRLGVLLAPVAVTLNGLLFSGEKSIFGTGCVVARLACTFRVTRIISATHFVTRSLSDFDESNDLTPCQSELTSTNAPPRAAAVRS